MNPIIPQNRYVITLTQLGELSPDARFLVRRMRPARRSRPGAAALTLITIPRLIEEMGWVANSPGRFLPRKLRAQQQIIHALAEYRDNPNPTYIEV